ncbi:MAG TPA: pitrilysin family protein [Armatimonadota bacterium]|jgi:zinc protease
MIQVRTAWPWLRLLGGVLALSLVWGASGARAVDLPPVAPAAGAPQDVRLDNGLRLVYQYNPASPVVAVCVFVHTSAAQETFNSAGVRELLQFMGERTMVRSGAPAEALPPVFDLTTSVSRDYAEMVALCLPADLVPVLGRLRSALFDPVFDDEALQFAQTRLLQEVQARQSVAPAMAQDVLVARLYPQWPGSWPLVGNGAATWVDLDYARQFHARHYLSNQTLVAVAGPLPWEGLRADVEKAFGSLLPGKQERLLPPPVGAAPGDRLTELRMPGSPVSTVVIGARAPALVDADYPTASVLMALLGNGRGSRLYHRLREEASLSYSLEAGVTPSQVCPYMYALANCEAREVPQVRQVLEEEIARLAQTLPTEEELGRARQLVWGQYLLQQQDNQQLSHFIGLFSLLVGEEGPARWSALPLRLAAVRPEQVQALARTAWAQPLVVTVTGAAGGTTQSQAPVGDL